METGVAGWGLRWVGVRCVQELAGGSQGRGNHPHRHRVTEPHNCSARVVVHDGPRSREKTLASPEVKCSLAPSPPSPPPLPELVPRDSAQLEKKTLTDNGHQK